MKRLAVLCSAIALLSAGLNTVSAQTIKSPDEKWIPIPVGGNTIFIPAVNFSAEQVNQSQYQLSWNNQSGATSYKIERLSVNYSALDNGLTVPEQWTELANSSDTNFTVNHDLLSFDLGGNQTFRLSTCDGTSCEVLAQLNYFLLAKDIENTIPQNVTMALDTTATAANLEISKQSNNKSNSLYNRYRRGTGYSMVFGHSDDPEPEATSATSKNRQALRTNQQAQHYTLNWDSVDKANAYVVMRYDDKGDSPTKAFINRVDRTHKTLNTYYNYQLLSGTYHFEIYACYKAGSSSKSYEYCGGESEKQTITGVVIDIPNVSLQPQNVAYSDPCLLYTSPSPRDMRRPRMPSSA